MLKSNKYTQIVIDTFQWLVKYEKCTFNAFVIIPNHFHLHWKVSDGFERKNVQGALFSFTAHEFKKHLAKSKPLALEKHFVNLSDREYQFWEREPMIKECWTKNFFTQKFNTSTLIHVSPSGTSLSLLRHTNGHRPDFMKQVWMILAGSHILIQQPRPV